MKTKWICLLFFLASSCSTSHKCEPFFVYKSAQINIKGISTKLRKNGVIKESTIGSIFIDPKYVQASDELQKLDLYQTKLCEQLNLIKDDSLKNVRRSEYVSTLMEMMKIAQRPDSLLNTRVVKLETAEEKRVNEEQYFRELKRTVPNVDFNLSINPDGTLLYIVEFLNDVPIGYKIHVGRYDNRSMTVPFILLGPDDQLHPSIKKRWVLDAGRKVNDPQLSDLDTFRIRASFDYYSIYMGETRLPGMRKQVTKVYWIDRVLHGWREIKE